LTTLPLLLAFAFGCLAGLLSRLAALNLCVRLLLTGLYSLAWRLPRLFAALGLSGFIACHLPGLFALAFGITFLALF
jgi:hypothetical protein